MMNNYGTPRIELVKGEGPWSPIPRAATGLPPASP